MNFNIFKKNYYKPKIAWLLFIILIMSSLISDYILRLKSSDFYSNNLNETIWFGIHIIAFINLILFITKPQLNFIYIKKLLIHLIPAVFVYFLFIYSYIFVLGIDSF